MNSEILLIYVMIFYTKLFLDLFFIKVSFFITPEETEEIDHLAGFFIKLTVDLFFFRFY